ncbi:MAG: hypothetical protein GC159_17645 [Phycisphaera sp.]|nr:hypothetical protein [Phycisphaera sp.]
MPTGRVKWFDRKKGFGFVIGPVGQDVFVHYTHIIRVGFKFLKEGEAVRYHLLHTDKGWQARGIEPLEDGAGLVDTPPIVESGTYEPPLNETAQAGVPAAASTASQAQTPGGRAPQTTVRRSGGYVGSASLAEAG